jgi:hypothetical protein
MRWPDGGPWLVTGLPADGGWEAVTAALAVASKVRVAALVVAGREYARSPATKLVRDTVATYVEISTGGAGGLRVEDLVGLMLTVQMLDFPPMTEPDLIRFAAGIHVLPDARAGKG